MLLAPALRPLAPHRPEANEWAAAEDGHEYVPGLRAAVHAGQNEDLRPVVAECPTGRAEDEEVACPLPTEAREGLIDRVRPVGVSGVRLPGGGIGHPGVAKAI